MDEGDYTDFQSLFLFFFFDSFPQTPDLATNFGADPLTLQRNEFSAKWLSWFGQGGAPHRVIFQ